MSALDVAALTDNRLGRFDVPCPFCSPNHNPKRKVLRIWRTSETFATYKCVRCGEKGFVRFDDDREDRQEETRREPAEPRTEFADTVGKARYLWSRRQTISPDTPPYRYLREARGYAGSIPPTLAYLPPSKPEHHHAMIAAFAVATKPEPGSLDVAAADVRAVHLTLLKPDGSGKADCKPNKIIVGTGAVGTPIVLAPPNDLLGLAITEGIENALTIHEATELGAWAAGCADRLPALAAAVPPFLDCITVVADPDDVGLRNANSLVSALLARGLHCELKVLGSLSP